MVPSRLFAALLLQQLMLQGCFAIYSPDEEPMSAAPPRSPDPEDDGDNEDAGVITVHAGKRKPPSGSWGSSRPPSAGRDTVCPPPSTGRHRRFAATSKSKPLPVRERIGTVKRQASNYHCPDSWKDLDFSEVQELECPENATGWYPFPPDCRKYLNCWRGRGFIQACAPATLFNPLRRECDYPEKVRCLPNCRSEPTEIPEDFNDGDPTVFVDPDNENAASPLLDVRSGPSGPVRRVPPPATGSGLSRSRRSDDSRHQPRQTFNSARQSSGGGGGIRCNMEGGTGLAPHPVECNKFVNCWKGTPHIQVCAGNTYFSTRLNACDHAHNVPECVAGKRTAATRGADGDGVALTGAASQPTGYTQHTGHGGHGGYNQFGNQGYQPPPRQTFAKPTTTHGDQVPAASNFQGYSPNQVLPPSGARGKVLYPQLQPIQPGRSQYGSAGSASDPNLDVEGIGPLPQDNPRHAHGAHGGHSETWHREHGIPMPGPSPVYTPPHHPHHPHNPHQPHHPHSVSPPAASHHHQHNPQPEGGYTPPPNWYDPNRGGYSPRPQQAPRPGGGYGLEPGAGGYGPFRGAAHTPHPGGHSHGHSLGHNPQWHRDHGVPMPDDGSGKRPDSAYATTTPSYLPSPPTTCAPEENEEAASLDWDLDLRSGDSSNWINVLDRTKNSSMPQSGQMVRLRGYPTPVQGYVEVLGPGSKWGSVCDKPANWTVKEASVVCRMLGYERGAELAWQGRPRHGSPGALTAVVEEVRCAGDERSLANCVINSGDGCNIETQAVGVRCHPNYAAKCRPAEVQFKGSCYSLVIPRQDRQVDAIAFSQDEAIKHCKSQGGHLLDINSQAENDFLSEWLTASYPALGSVLTAGVGVSVPGRSVWVWEGTGAPFQYSLWWPGPPSKDQDSARSPKVGGRPLCILLKKDFPCDSWPGGPGSEGAAGRGGLGGGTGYGSWQGARTCTAEYFFWHAEDCAIRQKAYPYVCERKAEDIGCLGDGEYEGSANVSWDGRACLAWDSPAAVSSLRYRISEDVRLRTLTRHNRCRRVDSQVPWCFVDAVSAGIQEEFCDIPVCRENTGNVVTANVTTRPLSGQYQPDGLPRPPAGDSSPTPHTSLSRPYPPVYRPRDPDDPKTDPRGTMGTGDASFPTLPTSRTYLGLPTTTPAAWPDPFANRRSTPRPFPTLPTSRTPTPTRPANWPPRLPSRQEPWPGGHDPASDWPVVNYAPGFSHREGHDSPQQLPPPPPTDLLPPYEDDLGVQMTAYATTYSVPLPPSSRDREEYVPPEDRSEDYPDRPDPLTMPLQPRSLGTAATTRSPVLVGYGARPDPSRGYGLPWDGRGDELRPPVATARPPVELYSSLRPWQGYAPYNGRWTVADSRPPSYSNQFGLHLGIAEGRHQPSDDLNYDAAQRHPAPYLQQGPPREQPATDHEGRHSDPHGYPGYLDGYPEVLESDPVASGRGRPDAQMWPHPQGASHPGISNPYSRVGYHPRPNGEGDNDGRQGGVGGGAYWPPTYNGHSDPGLRWPSRASRTATTASAGTATERGATETEDTVTTPASTGGGGEETARAAGPAGPSPPFSRPSEHVMKIPRPGQQQVTTEMIFFM